MYKVEVRSGKTVYDTEIFNCSQEDLVKQIELRLPMGYVRLANNLWQSPTNRWEYIRYTEI